MPLLRTVLMACWVGFVFCSPWMMGTYETWICMKLSRPARRLS